MRHLLGSGTQEGDSPLQVTEINVLHVLAKTFYRTFVFRLTYVAYCVVDPHLFCGRQKSLGLEGVEMVFLNPDKGQGLPEEPTYDLILTMDAVRILSHSVTLLNAQLWFDLEGWADYGGRWNCHLCALRPSKSFVAASSWARVVVIPRVAPMLPLRLNFAVLFTLRLNDALMVRGWRGM